MPNCLIVWTEVAADGDLVSRYRVTGTVKDAARLYAHLSDRLNELLNGAYLPMPMVFEIANGDVQYMSEEFYDMAEPTECVTCGAAVPEQEPCESHLTVDDG